jgi:hypothetical protein
MTTSYQVAADVISEAVGDDVIVMRSDSNQTLRLSGEAAIAFTAVQAGQAPSGASREVLQSLVDHRVLSADSPRTVSRRGLVTGAAVGVGAGLVTLALPTVAAASSQEVLPGFYVYDSDKDEFEAIVYFNFPTSLGDGDGSGPIAGSSPAVPGPLLGLAGVTGTFETDWNTSADPNVERSNGVLWVLTSGGSVTLTGTGDISTSFVWDGVTYPLRLKYDPNLGFPPD